MVELFMLACAVLFVVPIIFVWHSVYEDGLVGRISLCGISFSAATYLIEWLLGDTEYVISLQRLMFVSSFATFICWHLWRFHRRVLHSSPTEKKENQRWPREGSTAD